jgi:hypothetical protein
MRVSRYTTFIVIISIACGFCLARNQTPKTMGAKVVSTDQLSDIKKRDAALGTTAKAIAKKNPDAVPELMNDADVILSSRQKVFGKLSRAGYDKDSQKKAEAYVWKDVRLVLLKSDESLDEQRWETQMAERGRLGVSSLPDHADIYVDNGNALSRSNNFIFPTVGVHKICLKLEGYQDHCEQRLIQSGTDNVAIIARLKAK